MEKVKYDWSKGLTRTSLDLCRKVVSKEIKPGDAVRGMMVADPSMNKNSAEIFQQVIRNVLTGKGSKRNCNIDLLDNLLKEIYDDSGKKGLVTALNSIKEYIDYYKASHNVKKARYIMRLFHEYSLKIQYSIPRDYKKFIEEEDNIVLDFVEGETTTKTYKSRNREKKIRKLSLDYHGTVCQSCGFDPVKKYGKKLGLRALVAHHKNPMKEGIRTTNNKKDMALVCCNCHSILHTRKHPYSLKWIRRLFK